nr:potassium transporter TrkG [uncultured Anaerostipes sp.]
MKELRPVQVILLGFLITIFAGSILLALPIATQSGQATPYIDALFTATTSVCVTGLIVETTMTYWSIFGQAVIILLVQIGGLGVITITTGMFFMLRKRITLGNRMLIQESMGLNTMTGLVPLVKKILIGTGIIEGIGAVLYATQYVPEFGIGYGIWAAIFNSISAFCNAGMDIVRDDSLRSYVTNPVMNFTTMGLIILGGLGFVVWKDLWQGFKKIVKDKVPVKRMIQQWRFQTKIVLSITSFLILFGTILIFLFEYHNPATMESLSLPQKIQASLFQSVTTRTAGFETVAQAALTDASSLVSMFLMIIGGSPTGTAGGVKTVTFAILVFCVLSVAKQEESITLFKRRVPQNLLSKALAIIVINLIVLMTSVLLLLVFDHGTFMDSCYECVSALATVGLTKGLTPNLTIAGKVIIIITMYLGRVGPISMAIGFSQKNKKKMVMYPEQDLIL